MVDHPKELSLETLEKVKELLPEAQVDIKSSTASWIVKGKKALVRVKRAQTNANQVQVWRGEPLLVHVPADENGDERWYVLSVAWQLSYARKNPVTARQHASNAFDCMRVSTKELSALTSVSPPDIRRACEEQMVAARLREVRFTIRALLNTRTAVADALVQTMEEVMNEPEEPEDDDEF